MKVCNFFEIYFQATFFWVWLSHPPICLCVNLFFGVDGVCVRVYCTVVRCLKKIYPFNY